MPLIDWNNGYFSLSIEEIDAQHKTFVDIMNKLHISLMNNNDYKIVEETLNALARYAQSHFSYEEEHMKKMNYPDLEAHKAQHNKFREVVFQLRRDYNSNYPVLSSQVMSRLKNWLVDHILNEDKKYGDFYLKQTS